jgi:hypothetical protein
VVVLFVPMIDERLLGTAAPGELRKSYREQIQDIVYGAMVQ